MNLGVRVAVSSFLFLSIFKEFLVRFWIFLAPTHNEKIQLSLQDIIVGVVTTKCPSHHLLNYMLLIGKVYLWVCRANKTPTKIHGFKKMIVTKYESERLISVHSETTSFLTRKWFISLENFVWNRFFFSSFSDCLLKLIVIPICHNCYLLWPLSLGAE